MTKHRSASSSSALKDEWVSLREQLLQFVAVLLVAAVVAFVGINVVEWQKRRSLLYCDSSDQDNGNCIPCPENGRCWKGHLECLPSFKQHGKSCVQDLKIESAANRIAEFLLQKACGKWEGLFCRRTEPQVLNVGEIPWILEDARIDNKLNLDDAKLVLVHEEALKVVRRILVAKTSPLRGHEMHCPVELLERYKPFWCRIQEWVLAHPIFILFVSVMVLMVWITLLRARHRQRIACRAEELYLQVCEILEEKVQAGGESWVVASYLRDHLLTPRERKYKDAWLLLEKMVHDDSRIDQYPKLVKGESKVVWEWQVKASLKSPTSRKGR